MLCASVPDRPLGLSELLAVIDGAGLSVEYMYSFFRSNEKGRALMILRLNDGARAAEVFAANNVLMLSQDEVDRL